MRVGITMRVPRESVSMENYQTTKKKEFKQASISKDDKKNKKAIMHKGREIYGMIKHA